MIKLSAGSRLAVILFSIVLFFLLYFAPKMGSNTTSAQPESDQHNTDQSLADMLQTTKSTLQKEQLAKINALEEGVNSSEGAETLNLLDSLAETWLVMRQPGLSAYYLQEIAARSESVEDYSSAGKRFRDAAYFGNAEERHIFYHQAIECFNKALKLDSSNLESKLDLASCLVEQGEAPMKGIGMFKEVLNTDSLNKRAHFQLGMFSIQSGQFDKAIFRFEKVLKIDPELTEVYIYLGEAHDKLGEKEKAIENFEKYIEVATDSVVKVRLQQYINELKNS